MKVLQHLLVYEVYKQTQKPEYCTVCPKVWYLKWLHLYLKIPLSLCCQTLNSNPNYPNTEVHVDVHNIETSGHTDVKTGAIPI